MASRREFLKGVTSGTAGLILVPQAAGPVRRREVSVGGRRVKVVDVHGHCLIPETQELIKDNAALAATFKNLLGGGNLVLGPERLRYMDEQGIDVQAISINAWWYGTDRELARRIITRQNEKLAEWCAAHPDRFVGLASVALQHPDLAAEQLEDGVKRLGLRGAAIGGSVEGEELSAARFDPFWAKAEALGIMLFVHPQPAPGTTQNPRLQGKGGLGNTIGNPLETTVFFSHLIFEGTLDRFPGLKICGAHGGGYLPSYSGRSDALCGRGSGADCKALKKRPSEYFKKELFVDTMVFHEEGLRHLVAELGITQIVYGTDYPFDWPVGVDFVLKSAFLSNADKVAILGGNAARLLRIT
ncbi:MAG: amidohydrolase family protein [Acidobacteriota bacterium]